MKLSNDVETASPASSILGGMAVETGQLALRTIDGEWPAWATMTYELPTDGATFRYTGDRNRNVWFDGVRFTEPDGTYEYAIPCSGLVFRAPHLVRVPRHPLLPRILGRWAYHPRAARLGLAREEMQSDSDTISFRDWRRPGDDVDGCAH